MRDLGRQTVGRSREAAEQYGKENLGVNRKTSGAAVRGELGWWRMEARRDLAQLRFWGKLVRMDRSRIVKRIYVERRRMMYEGQGRGVELGLRAEWESEAVGTKQQWGAKLTTASPSGKRSCGKRK